MKKVLIISYISKEKDGRTKRHFEMLSKQSNIDITLVQACRNQSDCSKEKNIVDIVLDEKKSNFKQYLEFYACVKKIIKSNKFDYLLLLNYFSAPLARLCGNSKILYDAYELYYPGCGKKFSIRDILFWLFERNTIKTANLVISANKQRALIMVGVYKLQTVPIVISNNPIIKNHETVVVDKEFAIVYAGYLSKERELDRLIEAVKAYNQTASRSIELHFYGVGDLESYIVECSKKDSNIKYCGGYKNENLNSILRKYMFGYIAYDNFEMNTRFCSPNKLYDYIFNENVVICNNNESLCEFVVDNNIGTCGDNFEISIANAVNHYNDYYQQIKKIKMSFEPAKEYNFFESFFSD